MFQLRHTFRVRAWLAGHWHRSQSFPPVAEPPVQGQTDSLRLGWQVLFLPASRTRETERETAFAPGFALPNTGRTKGKLRTNGKSWYVLDSSFLLQRFFPEHCLHNPDLSTLATVDIGREIEQISVLPRAGSVEQV